MRTHHTVTLYVNFLSCEFHKISNKTWRTHDVASVDVASDTTSWALK